MSNGQFDKLAQRWRDERVHRKALSRRLRSRLLNCGGSVFQKYGVRRVWLFGSVSQECALVDSDVDVLVSPLSAEDYWPLRRELEAVVGHPIDLYTQDDDDVFVRKVMVRGELIYDVQPGTA